jgi:hypothetical protein
VMTEEELDALIASIPHSDERLDYCSWGEVGRLTPGARRKNTFSRVRKERNAI